MNAQDNGPPLHQTASPGAHSVPMPVPGTETMRISGFMPGMLPGLDLGPQLPSALNAAPTAHTLWRSFLRVAPMALIAGTLAGALCVAAICLIAPPKYPVQVLVKVDSSKGAQVLGGNQEDTEFSMLKSFQMELIKSPQVINRALEMQVKDLAKGGKGAPVDGRFVKELPLVQAQSNVIDWLQAIKAEPHQKSQEIIVVSAATRDRPEDLTVVMNALGKALEDENQAAAEAKHHRQIEEAQAKQTEGSARLEQKRKLLANRTRGTDNDAAQQKTLERLETQLRDENKNLSVIRLEASGVDSQIKSLEAHMQNADLANAPPEMINELVKNDLAAAPLLLEQQKTSRDLSEARRLTDNPNEIARYADRKNIADRAIEDYKLQNRPFIQARFRDKVMNENAAEKRKLKDRLVSLKQQEQQVTGAIAGVERDIAAVRPTAQAPPDVVALKTDIDTLEKAQAEVTHFIALLKFNSPKSRVSVHQTAIVPGALDYSRFTKLAGAGGLGGFLLVVLGLSFREFRSRKICSDDEVSRGLGLQLIGTVPALPETARNPLVGQGKIDPIWQNQLVESIDTIRTQLLHNARSNNTRVIMISSANGGEGKTSLASQLAASMARAWKKTLLIDGDLRSPSAHKLFEVPQEPGFSEVLRGELNAGEAVRSTPLSRLWIMPAGHWDSHAVQALAQDNVRTLLEELKQQYDFIILDSSPILPVADALLLGQNVDGVLLAVMRETSRAPALYAAHQRLEGLGIKTLGAVMMGATSELSSLGYKYSAQARR